MKQFTDNLGWLTIVLYISVCSFSNYDSNTCTEYTTSSISYLRTMEQLIMECVRFWKHIHKRQ